MADEYPACPKCGNRPAQPLPARGQCPACGVYPFKWEQRARGEPLRRAAARTPDPEVYDALVPQMMLLGGHTGEDGPHDWIFLLQHFGQVPNAQRWGRFAHTLGALAAGLSLAWAALVLWRQWRRRAAPA